MSRSMLLGWIALFILLCLYLMVLSGCSTGPKMMEICDYVYSADVGDEIYDCWDLEEEK